MGGRRGTYVARRSGALKQAIGVVVSDTRGGAFNVQLSIDMPLRCAQPPHDVVLLLADIAADRIRIEELWVHDPKLQTWWASDQLDQVWAALVERGIPWLNRCADPSVLVDHFELEYRRLEELGVCGETVSWPVSLGRRLGLISSPPKTAHADYLLWLSQLYEELGEHRLAYERLHRYMTAHGARLSQEEKLRLERHRKALEAALRRAQPFSPSN